MTNLKVKIFDIIMSLKTKIFLSSSKPIFFGGILSSWFVRNFYPFKSRPTNRSLLRFDPLR